MLNKKDIKRFSTLHVYEGHANIVMYQISLYAFVI